jgi:hypothetical protein
MGRQKNTTVTRHDSVSSENSNPDKLSSLDAITQKLLKLESIFIAVQEENKRLEATIDTQQATILNPKPA